MAVDHAAMRTESERRGLGMGTALLTATQPSDRRGSLRRGGRLVIAATESVRAKRALAIAWLAFVLINFWLMVHFVGAETIPYHLIWASYALLYGLFTWSRQAATVAFLAISVATGIPLLVHARLGAIGWSECSEIVLMGVVVAVLMWHVDRHRAAQRTIAELLQDERARARHRELTAKFGSHEVRTRLTVARGLVELIRDATPDVRIHSDTAMLLEEIDKATATATKLLDLVRVETPNSHGPVHVDSLVRVVVGRWAAARERTWAASSSVGFILADAERLEAALDGLIENAVKFTQVGDEISVTAGLEKGDVFISVADSGTGIPPGDLERIFELFQTGSTAGDRGGSGLGLALVSAIAQAHGGTLTVTSDIGVGSQFTLRFPTSQSVGPNLTGPGVITQPRRRSKTVTG